MPKKSKKTKRIGYYPKVKKTKVKKKTWKAPR
jgi:hypothetical protein